VVMSVHDQLDSLSGPGIYTVVLVMIAAEMNSNNHGCSRREKYCREQKHGNQPSSQFHAENIADRDSQVQCSGPPILWSRTSTWNANKDMCIRSVKSECTRRLILVPYRLATFEHELALYFAWHNEHQPHTWLGGATPDEIY